MLGTTKVRPFESSRLYKNITGTPDYYFTHSFRMLSRSNIGITPCLYGDEFIASYEVSNIAGVQFHPELSQTNGLNLLKNFIELF
ncbi:hypothetical protein RS130_21440 [Paraglaciecola aquimarina]|uniref:Glutamine amidotransferase domain-containing protein n=1 Tax=Paraglaciecola aquimarina TaxID=1235557 RepID=A0ABU3T1I9_9ALTE|nr:hypothetical protein [Paraglaciecola aquimarina]MDU0356113.1 hypothetical protein [Paraglaciecola aquimarina]